MKDELYSFEKKTFYFFIVLFTGTNFLRLIANDKCTSLSTSINGLSRKITNVGIYFSYPSLHGKGYFSTPFEDISFNENDFCWALFSESNILLPIGKEIFRIY